MTEGTSGLRGRAIVASWFAVFVTVLVVLAVVGGAAAYVAHVDPGTETEQVERTHWQVDGAFYHSADVTRENPVFPVDSTLSNRSTYYTGPTPVLDGQFVLTYSGGTAEPATVDLDAALVIQSSADGSVFWTDRTPLEGVGSASVAPGESVPLDFSLNATDVADRRASIRDALGDTQGEVSTFVTVDATVAGSVDGRPVNRSFTHQLPISVAGETYSVGPEEAGSEPVTTTRTVSTPREYGPLWSVGGPLLALLGVSGIVGLAVGRRRGTFSLSEGERDLLAFRDERAEFDEWVVRARLSTEFADRPRAEAESLEDVVDFAIDAGTGVVENPDTGQFYAIAEELVVVYDPPPIARRELQGGEAEEDGESDVASLLGDGVALSNGEEVDDEDGDWPSDDSDGSDGGGQEDDESAQPDEDAPNHDGNTPESDEDVPDRTAE